MALVFKKYNRKLDLKDQFVTKKTFTAVVKQNNNQKLIFNQINLKIFPGRRTIKL
jgi:hypothetical protein